MEREYCAHEESRLKLFGQTATLVGRSSQTGASVTLEIQVELHRSDMDLEATHKITFTSPAEQVHISGVDEFPGDGVFDIRDLAMCLRKVSSVGDMRIELTSEDEVENGRHSAQLCIYQNLFSVSVLMFCKNTKKYVGLTYLDVLLPNSDSLLADMVFWRRIISPKEDVALFANTLNDLWLGLNSAAATSSHIG